MVTFKLLGEWAQILICYCMQSTLAGHEFIGLKNNYSGCLDVVCYMTFKLQIQEPANTVLSISVL